MLNLVKECLGINNESTIKDNELKLWIEAGKKDLERQGIDVNIFNPLIKSAIVMYVKSNFGFVDEKDKAYAQNTYSLLCQNLGLSLDYKEDSNA